MAKLPKSIIKKYGITKKAWQVFRGQKASRSRSPKRSKTRYYTMARRRTSKRRSGNKGKIFGFSIGKVVSVIAGAAIAAVYEVFVSPMIPISANIKNWIELALGLFLAASPRMPTMVRAGGAALATINAYSIIMPFIAGSGLGSGSGNWD